MPDQKSDTFRLVPAGLPTDIPGQDFDPNVGQLCFNGFIETTTNPLTGNKVAEFVQRPGTTTLNTVATTSDQPTIRGAYTWKDISAVFIVIDDTVYKATGTSLSTITSILTFPNTGGTTLVDFCEVSYGLKKYLFFTDGNYGFYIDKDTPTVVRWVSSSQVIDVAVTAGGTGYTSNTTCSFSDPTTGVIVGTYVATAGTYVVTFPHDHQYTTSDRVYFDATSGTGADGAYAITATTANTLTFTTGALTTSGTCKIGITARATVTVANDNVISIDMVQKGIGYASAPTVTITDSSTASETGAAATAILSGFPQGNAARKPTSIDGYVLVGMRTTSDVYNSGLGELDYWGPDEYITVNQYPGNVVALAKQANQCVVLKTDSIEFLYNAGNAEGSPFGRTSQAVVQIGLLDEKAVDDREDILFFVGKTNIGNIGVWKIEGFKDSKVSIEVIDRFLTNSDNNYSLSLSGYSLRSSGHFFFVITSNITGTPSIVYDMEEKYWYYWSYSSLTQPFSGVFATETIDTNNPTQDILIDNLYNGARADYAQADIAVVGNTIRISKFAESVYLDGTTNIPCVYQYPMTDIDTLNRKVFHQCSFIGDYGATSGHTNASDVVSLYQIDNEWNTISSARNRPLTTRPYWTNLGTSRRRAWRVEHSYNSPFRMRGLEFKYTINAH